MLHGVTHGAGLLARREPSGEAIRRERDLLSLGGRELSCGAPPRHVIEGCEKCRLERARPPASERKEQRKERGHSCPLDRPHSDVTDICVAGRSARAPFGGRKGAGASAPCTPPPTGPASPTPGTASLGGAGAGRSARVPLSPLPEEPRSSQRRSQRSGGFSPRPRPVQPPHPPTPAAGRPAAPH